MGDGCVVTLGGKGSSLSSSSLYAVATGRAHVRIDSSALDRLSSTTTTSSSSNITIPIPEFLTPQQTRAFLLDLLNKLLHCNSPSRIPQCISEALNSNTFRFENLDATEDEQFVLNNSRSAFIGPSAILDHQSAALSALADVAAALSCEALKADVSAFNLIDSGDGHTSKDEVGVAADMRVLLNGSKLVGKDNKIPSVSRIPEVHGIMRKMVKLVHSEMRVQLNSGHGSELALCTVLSPLAQALRELGECSFARAQSNLASIGSSALRSSLVEIFGKECPTDASLSSHCVAALNLVLGKDYDKFAHEISVLLGLVWKIVAWEVVTAFAVLEAAELSEKIQDVRENGEGSKAEKKKKKVVLGKGTSSILPLIKDRLQRGRQGGDVENSWLLETLVADFLSFLDVADPEFNEFLLKVKDIVESNESRRLPKIPKVFLSSYFYGYDCDCVA